MKPAPFTYADPSTTSEAVSTLHEHGMDAKVLAGGQSLVPLMNMRLAQPGIVVDLNGIEELDYIRRYDGGVAIGALTTQRDLETDPLIAEHVPALRSVMDWVGHPQLRNRGTVGGSIAHADPAAELPAATLALDAEIVVTGPEGTRTLDPDDLFLGYLMTTLEPDEILAEIRFPTMSKSAVWSIQEVARRHGDFAMAGTMAVLQLESEKVTDARIACFGVGGRAIRIHEVEEMLKGERPDDSLLAEIAARVAETVEADDDLHASAEYRRSVAGALTRRAVAECLSPKQQEEE